MRLKIGLLEDRPSWLLFMRQLGASFERLESSSAEPGNYSAIIVNRPPNSSEIEMLREYVRSGGVVLDCGYLGMNSKKRRNVRWVSSSAGQTILPDVWLCDLYANTNHGTKGEHLDQWISFVGEGRGWVASMPVDIPWTDTRRIRKSFYSPSGALPNEEVSKVSKGEWRKVVTGILQELHFRRGLPFVHLWFYPDNQSNVFLFRIDSDFGTRAQIRQLYDLGAGYAVHTTWFLHVAAHESWLDDFVRMSGQEIAVHGFEHGSYSSYEDNFRNIKKALEKLRQAGMNPKGMAAPFGLWNDGIGRTAEELAFEYGSEFSLDYDNLPSFPWLENRFSSVLQVPIHPVSIGNFIRIKSDPSHMKRYYRFMIEKKLSHFEPLAFYHHPTHEHWAVVEDLFQVIATKRIRSFSFNDYAAWWKQRSQISFDIYRERDELRVVSAEAIDDVRLCITSPEKRRSFVKLNSVSSVKDLSWEDIQAPMAVPSDIERIRKPSFRMWRHTIEDLKNRFQQ